MQKILLATDGSETSNAAAVRAAELAGAFAAQLHVLYVSSPYSYLSEQETNAFNLKAKQEADVAFARLKSIFSHLEINTIFREGRNTAQTIIDVASGLKVELIVLGSHGRTGLNRMVLGSVAGDVVNKARCDVLVCKPS